MIFSSREIFALPGTPGGSNILNDGNSHAEAHVADDNVGCTSPSCVVAAAVPAERQERPDQEESRQHPATDAVADIVSRR